MAKNQINRNARKGLQDNYYRDIKLPERTKKGLAATTGLKARGFR